MTDAGLARTTALRQAARRYDDVVDLAAALSLDLQPQTREEHGWLGRQDPEAQNAGLLAVIERQMPARPTEVITFLEDAAISGLDLARRAYAIVDAVDHLVGSRAHPARPPLTAPWKDLVKRLADTGRYNPEQRVGSVIPAPYNKGRAMRDAHHIGRRLRFTRPIPPYVVCYAHVSGLADWAAEQVPVALLPVPHRPGAAAHRAVAGSPTPQYEIEHGYTADDRQAMRRALAEIERRGSIPLALFPEAALDQAGVTDLSDEFVRLTRAGPGLQLLLLGHCGGANGHNAFTVLKRGGIQAWTQAKSHSYNLTNDTIVRDHLTLPPLATADEYYRERLDTPQAPSVTVADTPYGRLMIAICEDIGHLVPSMTTAVDGRVTHLIAPLLNRELTPAGWHAARVGALSWENQCISIVCTSAFLERHVRFSTGGAVDAPVTVMLTHRPPWDTSPTLRAWDPRGPALWVEDQCPSAGPAVTP